MPLCGPILSSEPGYGIIHFSEIKVHISLKLKFTQCFSSYNKRTGIWICHLNTRNALSFLKYGLRQVQKHFWPQIYVQIIVYCFTMNGLYLINSQTVHLPLYKQEYAWIYSNILGRVYTSINSVSFVCLLSINKIECDSLF